MLLVTLDIKLKAGHCQCAGHCRAPPSPTEGWGLWGDGYEGLKLAMFEAKIRYEGLVFRFWRPQNLKEHTWFWVIGETPVGDLQLQL